MLESTYGFSQDKSRTARIKLAGLPTVSGSGASQLDAVGNWVERGMDLSDALQWVLVEAEQIKTFDTAFSSVGKDVGEPIDLLE